MIDEVSGFNEKAILRWRLSEGTWTLETAAKTVTVSDAYSTLTVNSDVKISSAKLVEGWTSRYYSQKISTTVLEIKIKDNGKLYTMYKWSS